MDDIEQIGLTHSLWLIVSAAFVFLMLVGFLAREAGLTRGKNSANVASKSIGGISIAILLFWLVGFGLMFGQSGRGLGYYGASLFGPSFTAALSTVGEPELTQSASFFLFQALLCAMSLLIMLGAAAERIRFESALLVAILFAGLIYPIVGHWAWGGEIEGSTVGWLSARGFVDFGGASVIHSTAGWAALAMLFLTKPRIGRFASQGAVRNIPKSSPALVAIGTLLIWLGWFGLIGGQALRFGGAVDIIFVNLLVAGAIGTVAVIPASILFRSGRVEFEVLLGGALAGLVSVSAGVHVYTPQQVVVIALIGTWLMLVLKGLLLRNRIDDVTGAIPIHLAAGIWGTIAVSLFSAPEMVTDSLLTAGQLTTQIMGVIAIGVWSFVVMLICVNVLNLIFALRINEDEEIIGLNMAEQGETPDYSEYPGLGELLSR